MFVVMLTAMLILHFAYLKMSKKRLEKLERELDGEESRK
jgi:Tfp pilus assembly protein PilO